MTTPIVGPGKFSLSIAAQRQRQTPTPVSTFSEVLKGGAQVLLAGAEIASTMIGGSVLSAAVARARTKLGGPLSHGGSAGGASGGPLSGTDAAGTSGNSQYDAMRQLQEQSRDMNMFFLELQQKMQAENRRFTTVSNVLKSRHDTARSAINNIRN
ncbi:MAG: hypothetical protein J7M25_14175 [Deltaproteobacteria bacterium]|nr:hypothetical protein [Deltaproteobacteria bacterium]